MWYRLLGLRPDIMDDDEHLRSILLGEINSVLRYSVQLDHDIMELEARREALRVETLKMNDVLQQPANLYYLHPKHYKPFETEGGKITPLRNGRYRATKLFQQVRSNETFDTKAECEKWLNNVTVSRSGNKKERKLPKASDRKPEKQGRREANNSASSETPSKASRTPNSAISYSGGIEELQRHMDMDISGINGDQLILPSDSKAYSADLQFMSDITNQSVSIPSSLPSTGDLEDNIMCVICNNGDNEENNLIIICDGCSLPVHQACYGVQKIPEGDWLCAACLHNLPPHLRTCVLCPTRMGALKPTEEGNWSHVLCALWSEKSYFVDPKKMEPIGGCNIAILDEQERVNKTGGRQLCCVCNLNIGSTIKCKYPHCRKRFHATCARKNNFTLNITIGKNGLEWNAFCPAHSKP